MTRNEIRIVLLYERTVVSEVCGTIVPSFAGQNSKPTVASRPTTIGNFDAQSWTPFYEVS